MKKTHKKHIVTNASGMPEAVVALAKNMSDDFNNILTTVMAACSLVDGNKSADTELLEYVALIRSSAERAANLSNMLVHACEKNLVNPKKPLARDKRKIGDIVFSNDSSRTVLS